MIACSGCVYLTTKFYFPPVESWIWIIPSVLLSLSLVRLLSNGMKMTAPFIITLPLAIFGALGPGNLLSIIGIAQIGLIFSTIIVNWNTTEDVRNYVRGIALVEVLIMFVGAAKNYYDYYQLTPTQRVEMIPERIRNKPVFFYFLPI